MVALRQMALAIALATITASTAIADESHHQDDQFGAMQETVDQANQATDPAERQNLMHEHMKMMHEHMKSMGGMMGRHQDGEPQDQMQQMPQRMDMMQKMMAQMMEQMMSRHEMMMNRPNDEHDDHGEHDE